jgi:preprotein translocase subunit SecA
MPTILERLGVDPSAAFIRRHQKTIRAINDLESSLTDLSDDQLREKVRALQQCAQAGIDVGTTEDPLATLEDDAVQIGDAAKITTTTETQRQKTRYNKVLEPLLPEAFALMREAARRTVNERHFDTQLLGGIALHSGAIAEMRTGEGKTLVGTLPLFLNSLVGKGAHLVTVNDYLAKHAVEVYGPAYALLGLSVGVIVHDSALLYKDGVLVPSTRKEVYACDITYGTNNEFGFDYLRDNMAQTADALVMRDLYFAIVDEADSILIDEARTPLIISGSADESSSSYQRFAQLVPRLQVDADFTVDEKDRAVSLTRDGIIKMEQLLGVESIYGDDVQLAYHLEESLKAEYLFKRDKDYVVREGEVIIVDEFTGRLMPGRRYSEGLHQAIEAKEGVAVQRESITLATISFQNLFRRYVKLAGMTGTAMTESEEFHKIYGLEVLAIPTNRPMVRKDLPDQIYKNESGKVTAIIREIKRVQATGQPVLVGTISVEKNEELSKKLHKAGVTHEILNAKNHEREAEIIAQAGRRNAVTLATNMAGRGTDIMLGGIKPNKAHYTNEQGVLDELAYRKDYEKWEVEHEAVISLGGLHVLGTERHESRRIDNQLRGRAGRQGDPGSSQFFVSTEDDLMRIFGGERLQGMLQTMGVADDEAIQHKMISRSLESAQKRVEGHNFDIRKRVTQFDDVLARQRDAIYGRRRRALLGTGDAPELRQVLDAVVQDDARRLVGLHASGDATEWNLERLTRDVAAQLGLVESERIAMRDHLVAFQSDMAVEQYLVSVYRTAIEVQEEKIGSELFPSLLRTLYLQTIDALWVEHLTVMNELRTGIGLRGYAQTDPLIAYTQEGFRLFQDLVRAIDTTTARNMLRIERVEEAPAAEAPVITEGSTMAPPKTGRLGK